MPEWRLCACVCVWKSWPSESLNLRKRGRKGEWVDLQPDGFSQTGEQLGFSVWGGPWTPGTRGWSNLHLVVYVPKKMFQHSGIAGVQHCSDCSHIECVFFLPCTTMQVKIWLGWHLLILGDIVVLCAIRSRDWDRMVATVWALVRGFLASRSGLLRWYTDKNGFYLVSTIQKGEEIMKSIQPDFH